MKRNSELARSFTDIQLFHHNFPQRKEPAHDHPEHQFFIPLEGRFSIDLPQSQPLKTCLISPGDLLLIPASTSHSFTSLDLHAGEQLLGLISVELWQAFAHSQPQLCIARASQLLKELLWFLLVRPDTPGDEVFAKALVQIIVDAVTAADTPAQADFSVLVSRIVDARLKGVLQFLQEQFVAELNLKEVAAQFELTERTLQRLFQTELQTTPKQFLLKLRVNEAERLLKETRLSITDVAFEAGFGSFSSFILAFRAKTGQTPSDYRSAFLVR